MRQATEELCEARRWPGRLSNLASPKHKEQGSVHTKVHGVLCQRPVIFTVSARITSNFSPASFRVQIPASRRTSDWCLSYFSSVLSGKCVHSISDWPVTAGDLFQVTLHFQHSVALVNNTVDYIYSGMVPKVHHDHSQFTHLNFGTLA